LSDYVYFSFTVLTTTGFGDLSAATSAGRAVAVTEMLALRISRLGVWPLIPQGWESDPATRARALNRRLVTVPLRTRRALAASW
jgi:hypothetical protein